MAACPLGGLALRPGTALVFSGLLVGYGQKYRRDRGHLSHCHARTPHQNDSVPAPARAFHRAGIHVCRAVVHMRSTRRYPRLADPARHTAAVQKHEK
eukprot:2768013-Prymnesium_polylepis.1